MRLNRSRFAMATTLIGLFLSMIVTPSIAAEWQADPKGQMWVTCAGGFRSDDCIDKLEYFDTSTSSWISGTIQKNPLFDYTLKNRFEQKTNAPDELVCGNSLSSWNDACFVFPSIGPKGGDLIVSVQAQRWQYDVNASLYAVNGVVNSLRKTDNMPINGLPDSSRWRLTLKSDYLNKNGSWIQGAMKNPNFVYVKGVDGINRAVVTGETLLVNYPFTDDDQCGPTPRPKDQSFSAYKMNNWKIWINPYVYEFEKAKNLKPGGMIVATNGSCGNGAYFDANAGVLGIRMGGPHFNFDGGLTTGWAEASIRGDVIRVSYGVEPKYLSNIRVEVSYADGSTEVASSTTKYVPETDTIEIRSYGFHFSAANVKIKIGKGAMISNTPNKNSSKYKYQVTCVSGSKRQTFYSNSGSLTCPKGWKKG